MWLIVLFWESGIRPLILFILYNNIAQIASEFCIFV